MLWASVRTLSGDAPLPADLELLAAQHRDVDALGEQKRRVLRALKDLEGERALGKIDEADYEAIAMQYRDEAKALMRQMDADVAPALAEAEKVAREYLAAQGLGPAAKDDAAPQARAGARRTSHVRRVRDVERARRRVLQEVRSGDEDGGGRARCDVLTAASCGSRG